MVRIAHISDSHLGSSLFQLAERKKDAQDCLKKAVDMAMRHSPDVLVHTGDLFDNHYPTMDDISFAIELFKGIKDKVLTIVIQGNHDMPYGFRYGLSPLRALENADLIISTGDKTHRSIVREFDGKKMEFHLVAWTGNQTIASILNSKTPVEENATFFAHYIPIPKENLPIHFRYYGFGHAHNFWLDQEYDIGRPGSTCIVDWKREEGGKKKLIVVDIDNEKNEYTTETLNDVREFKFLTGLDVTGMGADEIEVS
ncbi:MAG: metallophosphoesterase, partial [Candidatus Thorarchaeota archaeon]